MVHIVQKTEILIVSFCGNKPKPELICDILVWGVTFAIEDDGIENSPISMQMVRDIPRSGQVGVRFTTTSLLLSALTTNHSIHWMAAGNLEPWKYKR